MILVFIPIPKVLEVYVRFEGGRPGRKKEFTNI